MGCPWKWFDVALLSSLMVNTFPPDIKIFGTSGKWVILKEMRWFTGFKWTWLWSVCSPGIKISIEKIMMLLGQLLLNFRHHYQHKHYQLVRIKFFLGAIAHLSDQLMVITTRLQEVERRKQCKKRKRKKPYQQQLHKDRVFLFSFSLYTCIKPLNLYVSYTTLGSQSWIIGSYKHFSASYNW